MRIIGFGDIHMSTGTLSNIVDIDKADLLILNGDLTNYGTRKDAKRVLDEVLSYNPQVIAQLGNLDNYDIHDYLEELEINLHGQAFLVQNEVCLIGVGGSNPTPFNTPTEYSERELSTIVNDAHRQGMEFIELAKPLVKRSIPLILISHAPPFGTQVDRLRNGRHVGSTAIRKFIELHQPSLCICGHIHEAKGEDTIGRTHIINTGMFRHNGWVDIHIEKDQITATLQ